METNLGKIIEDHALERVPDGERENWLKISWNTVGLITTLVIMFFGAVVCFVAGIKIALLAGMVTFAIGSTLGWCIARVAVETGFSSTLITRRYGLGVRGSALASLIFGFLIVGFLAVENGLLYRGLLFFLNWPDDWHARIVLYGAMTACWILLTAFGFSAVTRTSSLMIIGFLIVLAWMLSVVLSGAGDDLSGTLYFGSQLDPATLAGMGIRSDRDKFVFALNLLIGPACALALNTSDFGRYGKSTGHVAAAAMIAIFFQSLIMMAIGGVLMKSAAPVMVEYFTSVTGLPVDAARHQVLKSPDSIAATFMVFGGAFGFLLMILAQAKAQVLNTYSSSLCLTNLFDAVFRWKPGRITFVILANVIALVMLYGEILHFVEAWIRLLGVLLSALAATIILDYYVVGRMLKPAPAQLAAEPQATRRPWLGKRAKLAGPEGSCASFGAVERSRLPPQAGAGKRDALVNWAGVSAILAAVYGAHWLFRPYQPIEVLTSLACVAVFYPALRLTIFRPAADQAPDS